MYCCKNEQQYISCLLYTSVNANISFFSGIVSHTSLLARIIINVQCGSHKTLLVFMQPNHQQQNMQLGIILVHVERRQTVGLNIVCLLYTSIQHCAIKGINCIGRQQTQVIGLYLWRHHLTTLCSRSATSHSTESINRHLKTPVTVATYLLCPDACLKTEGILNKKAVMNIL